MQLPVIKNPAPKPSSWWHDNLVNGNRHVNYIHAPGDPSLCIGEIAVQARRRFTWRRYDKPVKVDTTRKQKPKIAESHHAGSLSQAIWALNHSYGNAAKETK